MTHHGTGQTIKREKRQASAEIGEHIAEFLRSGKQIRKISSGQGSHRKPAWNYFVEEGERG